MRTSSLSMRFAKPAIAPSVKHRFESLRQRSAHYSLITAANATAGHGNNACKYGFRGLMADIFGLLQRYNGPAPRYTSYPPAPHWRQAHQGTLIAALRKSNTPLSI